MGFYVDANPVSEKDYLTFVKLPAARVAFKRSNGKYLTQVPFVLVFASDDPKASGSGFTLEPESDGSVQIKSDVGWLSLVDGSSWITTGMGGAVQRFWPVKIDENKLALRAGNNMFCCLHSDSGATNILSASVTSITKEAILEVQELVLGRKIYNVVYQMEFARIFDETPYLAGSASLENSEAEEANMAVSVTYQDEKSYSFTRSVSLTAGVSASIEAGLPFIEKATITVNYEINGTFQWDNTTTTTTSVTATGSVPVPGKSTVIVDYVGTRGTCNVPYSYTQEDRSSKDGKPIYTDLVDGIYTGVSYYNFSFHVDDNGVFYFRHVQSGGRVLVDSLTMGFYVDEKAGDDEKAYLTFVDWSTLVKLPPNVSFKGDNGKYFRTRAPILEFEWGETTTTSTSVTATGIVPMPGKSTAIVDYVGTRGTCNIPYSYTQQDTSSVDGKIVKSL